MRLISVSSLSKIRFFANFSRGDFNFSKTTCPLIMINPHKVFKRDFAGDFWTTGARKGRNVFTWTARDKRFDSTGTKWKSGEPSVKGDCVYLQLVNSTENTFLATDNCAEKKKFICEVIQKVCSHSGNDFELK